MSYNLLGVASPGGTSAVIRFAEVLQDNTVLEEIDLSNNLLDASAAFCLAHGLRTNTSLKSFIVNNNPIGSAGIKFLLQSLNDNQNGKVQNLKMKETETIVQSKKHELFDPMSVEKDYALNMENIYDRVILFHLLDIDEKIVHNSAEEEEIQQGEWFIDPKLSGSAWTPPKEKDKDGKWSLGPELKGVLTFKFSLDPKRNPKGSAKEPDSVKGTIVDSKSLIRPLIPDSVLEKNIDLLIRLLIEENYSWQRELVDTMWQEYCFTFSQAKEVLKAIENDSKIYAWIRLFNRVMNRHFRYDIFQYLPNIESKQIAMKYLGESYCFTYYNPTGHYKLKLSNKQEREVALTLLMFNHKYKLLVSQGDVTDRSKMGNQSWFRNEKLSGVSFVYTEEFTLPNHGTFECDFIYLINTPHQGDETSQEKQDMVKDILLSFENDTDSQISAFRVLSEYMVLSSTQLGSFVDLIDNPMWKSEWYLTGIGRIYDIRNYDFVKKHWKYPETSREIYNRFGIYNLFSPYKCTGSYRLDLEVYEEKTVWKMLLELAKVEGYQYMTNVVLDGKPYEEINKEFVDKLPTQGIFEGTYVAPEEAADKEARERIGRKYFDWTSDDM